MVRASSLSLLKMNQSVACSTSSPQQYVIVLVLQIKFSVRIFCDCEYKCSFYRPQQSSGKVMFSQASVVIPFTGVVGVCIPAMHWGRHPQDPL